MGRTRGAAGVRTRNRGVGTTVASERRRPGRGTNRVSLAFLALAIVLAAVALFLALRDEEAEVPPPPPAEAGGNELIHVRQALEAEGLAVDLSRRPIRSDALQPPGQVLALDGAALYVFVYPDAAAAEAAGSAADPTTILPARSRTGTPIATETPRVFSQSNIVAALVGGTDDLIGAVERAIASLP